LNWLRDWWKPSDTSVSAVRCQDEGGVRYLYLGSRTVQSAMRIDDPVRLELAYTRAMMAALLFRPAPRAALLIGLGGGSLAKFIHHRLPDCRLEAVECSREVVEMARAHFSLPADGPRINTVIGDGADYLARRSMAADVAPVDLLLVDVYDADCQVADCATLSFFQSAAAALGREGVCAVNFWSDRPEFKRYRDHFLEAFAGRVLLLPVARPGNLIAFGFASTDGDWRWRGLRERARELELRHGLEFGAFVEALRLANPYTENRLLI